MNAIMKVALSISLTLLTVVLVDALKCWKCSSSTNDENNKFCDEPFNATRMTEQQEFFSLVEYKTPGGNFAGSQRWRPMCKKLTKRINNNVIVTRSFFFEDVRKPEESCSTANTPYYIEILFCETCSHDGCNGAEMDAKTHKTLDKQEIDDKSLSDDSRLTFA